MLSTLPAGRNRSSLLEIYISGHRQTGQETILSLTDEYWALPHVFLSLPRIQAQLVLLKTLKNLTALCSRWIYTSILYDEFDLSHSLSWNWPVHGKVATQLKRSLTGRETQGVTWSYRFYTKHQASQTYSKEVTKSNGKTMTQTICCKHKSQFTDQFRPDPPCL